MDDLRDCEGELSRALTRLGERSPFVEAMAQSAVGEGIRVDRKLTTVSRKPRLKGGVLRAWSGERWVEVATSKLDGASLAEATAALQRAVDKAGRAERPPGAPSTTRQEWADRPAHPMREYGTPKLIDFARGLSTCARAVPGIQDAQVRIEWTEEQRFYLNTAGARAFQLLSRVTALAVPIAIENGRVEFDPLVDGGLGGSERLKVLTEEAVTERAHATLKLLKARTAPAGTMTVLLDPSMSGTFAHESFGHGTEADQFLRDRSYLKPLLGKMVGPETVTIVDNGALPDAWGTIRFDDEGHVGQRSLLVERGRFVGALHDRATAAAYHVPATGNARRSDFLSREYVRMTNTYVEPGDWTFDELVREAKDGILLERATSGIEDPQGGQMQLKAKKGRKIEHGELTEIVGSAALSGKVLEFLPSIRGISHQADFAVDPGMCGKGHSDMLPAGTGGTYLLATAVVGPA